MNSVRVNYCLLCIQALASHLRQINPRFALNYKQLYQTMVRIHFAMYRERLVLL